MKSFTYALFFLATVAFAQATCPTGSTCITVPAQAITIPAFNVQVTINNTPVQIQVAIPQFSVPAQVVPLPASAAALPAGITWTPANGSTPGLLNVAGAITASGQVTAPSLDMTGGSALPPSTSGLYVWQLTSGELQPVAFTPYVLPALTVSQAAAPAVNTITLTP